MKRFVRFVLAIMFTLFVPLASLAANSVPAKALDARGSVFRVLCEDSQYIYSGSGFVVGANGESTFLVTNYHVIKDANPQSIVVVKRDGTDQPVTIVGYDKDYDLCILQSSAHLGNTSPLVIANQDQAAVGDAVYALGFPEAGDYLLDDYAYAVEDITVTDGIISAIKSVTVGMKKTTFLQMNAAINSGSSGGPLLNGLGQVVGVNTLGILDAQDVYAAVSTQHLKELLTQHQVLFQTAMGSIDQNSTHVNSPESWILFLIGTCTLLLIAGTALILLRSRRLTLATLMSRRVQGYPVTEALQKLAPVFCTLAPLHTRGEAHGQIYPSNLYMDRSGMLHLGKKRQRYTLNEGARPYKPIEQYDTNPGTFSDVYALGAVLVYMLSCTPPPDSMTRLQGDVLREKLNNIIGLTPYLRETIEHSMALKKENRLHDIGQFVSALDSAKNSNSCEPSSLQANDTYEDRGSVTPPLSVSEVLEESWLQSETKFAYRGIGLERERRRPQHNKIAKKRILIYSSLGVLLLAVATLFVINESGYRRAITFTEKGEYTLASDAIKSTFSFYRDSGILTDYISAGVYLELGYYAEAKDRFRALNNYRDAQKMVIECDYQRAGWYLSVKRDYDFAKYCFLELGNYSDSGAQAMECDYQKAKDLLNQGAFGQAKELFSTLSAASYRDSKLMIKETDYQHAMSIYNQFMNSELDINMSVRVKEAFDLLNSLSGYSESNRMLEEMRDAVYCRAIEKYYKEINVLYSNDFSDEWVVRSNAKTILSFFALVKDYNNCTDYITTCNVLAFQDTDTIFQSLRAIWDFSEMRNIVLSDWLIQDFLFGTWRGDGDFRIQKNSSGSYSSTYDIPGISGKYYKIENLIYFTGSDENGWRKMYTFNVINENVIDIYAYMNGRTYTLYRQ